MKIKFHQPLLNNKELDKRRRGLTSSPLTPEIRTTRRETLKKIKIQLISLVCTLFNIEVYKDDDIVYLYKGIHLED